MNLINKHLLQLGFGVATFIPGIPKVRHKRTGGTNGARYCYSVWLRHLSKCRDQGMRAVPRVVAELGPGDSLGVGFAALLSGADQYYALDVVRNYNNGKSVEIFDELLSLFQQRAPIPNENEFPEIHPRLDCYDFPSDILEEKQLNAALTKQRIEYLRRSLRTTEAPDSPITHLVPWTDSSILEPGSIDLIFSQAVLEHVDELDMVYPRMRGWLKPTGFMSHQIDFKSHGLAVEWNGHWTYSDLRWMLMRGRRPYYINRQPYSVHLGMQEKAGFTVICKELRKADSKIDKKDVAPSLKYITDDDLIISGAFLVSVPKVVHARH